MDFERTVHGLILTVDEEERTELRAMREEDPDAFQTDATMYDALDDLVCNSDIDWGRAEEIGALTDAPILVVREDGKIVEAYAFMDYQIKSVQDALVETGKAFFRKG